MVKNEAIKLVNPKTAFPPYFADNHPPSGHKYVYGNMNKLNA
jgi:hypothetical protein